MVRSSGRVYGPGACQAYARYGGSGRCSRPCSGRMDLELDDMKIAIIGLGNMGGGMAANLAKAGHEVAAFDLSETALAKRSEEHTSELQSLMRISYAVFCLKKKKKTMTKQNV